LLPGLGEGLCAELVELLLGHRAHVLGPPGGRGRGGTGGQDADHHQRGEGVLHGRGFRVLQVASLATKILIFRQSGVIAATVCRLRRAARPMPHVPATAAPRRGPPPGGRRERRAPRGQMSRLDTLSALSSMNSRRGSTTSPIRVLKIWSAATASSIRTCSRRRVSGLTVVSHSCSGFISPRPLKRWI